MLDDIPVNARIDITVGPDDFDVGREMDALSRGDLQVGAVASFVGLVRDLTRDGELRALELEHYPGMTEKALHRIAEEAALRWPLQAVRIWHRIGRLAPGERIVLVLTASAHRHAAYEANVFIMDYLKTHAPFWKKEWTSEGARWVDARHSDQTAAERWHHLVSERYGAHDHD